MRTLASIIIVAVIAGCLGNEQREKTFTARRVTEDNIFSYGSVTVKVNPDLQYTTISGSTDLKIDGIPDTVTKREFHIFTRSDSNKIVLIETHTRSLPHTFQLPHDDLTQKMAAIQKGKKSIDGKRWEVYIRALPEFPEQILSAVRQKGISIEPYRCGLEIGAGRIINRFNRIYVSYIMGVNECRELPQNGSVLNEPQLRMVREFAAQFDENITISDKS